MVLKYLVNRVVFTKLLRGFLFDIRRLLSAISEIVETDVRSFILRILCRSKCPETIVDVTFAEVEVIADNVYISKPKHFNTSLQTYCSCISQLF